MTHAELFERVASLYDSRESIARKTHGFVQLDKCYVPHDAETWSPVPGTPFPGGTMKWTITKDGSIAEVTNDIKQDEIACRTLVMLQDWGEYKTYNDYQKSSSSHSEGASVGFYKRTRTDLETILSKVKRFQREDSLSVDSRVAYEEFYERLSKNRVVYFSNYWLGLRIAGRTGPAPYRNDPKHRNVSREMFRHCVEELKPSLILYFGIRVFKDCKSARLTTPGIKNTSEFVVNRRNPSHFIRISSL